MSDFTINVPLTVVVSGAKDIKEATELVHDHIFKYQPDRRIRQIIMQEPKDEVRVKHKARIVKDLTKCTGCGNRVYEVCMCKPVINKTDED